MTLKHERSDYFKIAWVVVLFFHAQITFTPIHYQLQVKDFVQRQTILSN